MFGVKNLLLGKEDANLQQDSSEPMEQSNSTCSPSGYSAWCFTQRNGCPAHKTKVAAVIHKRSYQISPLCARRTSVMLITYSTNHLLWKCQSHFLHKDLLKNPLRGFLFQHIPLLVSGKTAENALIQPVPKWPAPDQPNWSCLLSRWQWP